MGFSEITRANNIRNKKQIQKSNTCRIILFANKASSAIQTQKLTQLEVCLILATLFARVNYIFWSAFRISNNIREKEIRVPSGTLKSIGIICIECSMTKLSRVRHLSLSFPNHSL